MIHQPGFWIPAVRWLIDTGRLGRRGGTGTDTFSPDVGIDETYTVSKLVYQRRRISLEILANLAKLPTTGAWVLAGGPIHRGDGLDGDDLRPDPAGRGPASRVVALQRTVLGRAG